MAELVVIENISLDGVMQSPGGLDEDTRGGFDRGGWAAEWLSRDPEAAMASMAGDATSTSLLFGRRTYTDLVGHWLSTSEPNPFTDVLRDTPKYVASRHAGTELPHPASTLLPGEAAETVTGLTHALDGEIVVLGSGELVRSLAAAGLVDRYVLTTIPVVLGRGTRLFGDTPAELTVERSRTFSSGISVVTYAVRRPGAFSG
ncbi:dihydrofolate reductase family protein [Desertihabitans aurantiacus]|uniref:dihydrofolate reductase family protein n=1 Tax=Desertihabitans aurantiacus TaxID=2282477 RepID=UPI001E29853F|nr:dihydrofolate reductase family protein [Desertihabitans aurantiacus]